MAAVPLVHSRSHTGAPPHAFRRHAALGLWAAGFVFLAGTILDIAILWLTQNQGTVQWEFVAVANTIEGLPRFALAGALCFAALNVSESNSLWAFRLLALLSIVVGLGAAGLGGLMATDYLVLRRDITPEALPVLKSTVVKSVALAGIFCAVFVPAGILGLRRPR